MSQERRERMLNMDELNTGDLKRIIAVQSKEIERKNEQLKGLQNLAKICSESEEKRQSWKTRAEKYESALRRAEARIAVLNKKLGMLGPQTAFDIKISRHAFDAITRENIELKEALEHIVPTELGGKDVVLRNQELYELVTKYQYDILQYGNHIKELEEALASSEIELAAKVSDLAKKNMKLERSMNAKQVFSEKLLKENKVVVNHYEEIIDELERNKSELSRQNEAENERKSVEIQMLMNQLEITDESKKKLKFDLNETVKKCSDFEKKLNDQVQTLEEKELKWVVERSELTYGIVNLRSQVDEKNAIIDMKDGEYRGQVASKQRLQETLANTRQALAYTFQALVDSEDKVVALTFLWENASEDARRYKNQQRANANYESPELD
ncbi:tropomyosin-1-like [Dendronephthya gigantea]|uniref:tropomyosin-1-like n=1 Tax=Dendronephthya gigantea TaxID=151771 RepID=UPI00106BCCA2|nr:tropomyosin-1-like [Dendronephthya gigantea]